MFDFVFILSIIGSINSLFSNNWIDFKLTIVSEIFKNVIILLVDVLIILSFNFKSFINGLFNVLLFKISIVFLPINVSVIIGNDNNPLFLIFVIIGSINVLLFKISILFLVINVSEISGNDTILLITLILSIIGIFNVLLFKISILFLVIKVSEILGNNNNLFVDVLIFVIIGSINVLLLINCILLLVNKLSEISIISGTYINLLLVVLK